MEEVEKVEVEEDEEKKVGKKVEWVSMYLA